MILVGGGLAVGLLLYGVATHVRYRRDARFESFLHLRQLAFYWDGKKAGIELHWYSNGQLWTERRYSNGLEDGVTRAWFPSGHVKYLKHFSRGLAHGEFWAWYDNGQVALYALYDHDREVTYKAWTWNGTPFYNYVWKNGEKVGLQGDDFCKPRKLSKI